MFWLASIGYVAVTDNLQSLNGLTKQFVSPYMLPLVPLYILSSFQYPQYKQPLFESYYSHVRTKRAMAELFSGFKVSALISHKIMSTYILLDNVSCIAKPWVNAQNKSTQGCTSNHMTLGRII